MTFILMILILGIMVLVHELGHFIPAKIFNISVPVFSIGFGKRLIGKKIGDTDYRISAFPLGGYVSLKGMDPGEFSGASDEFLSKPVWQRIVVIFFGPFSNLVFAYILLFIIVSSFGVPFINNMPLKEVNGSASAYIMPGDSIIAVNNENIVSFLDIYTKISFGNENTFLLNRDNEILELSFNINDPDSFSLIPLIKPVIGKVLEDSPAELSGLMKNDIIVSINGKKTNDWSDVSLMISDEYEKEISVTVKRGDSLYLMNMTPKKYQYTENDSIKNTGKIGIEYVTVIEKLSFTESVKVSFGRLTYIFKAILDFMKMLFTGKAPANAVGGPIAIYSMIGENLKWGIDALLSFVAFFSLNLCIFNLIPFPPLDGSYIVIYLFESIFRKKAGVKFMRVYQQIGFFTFMLLVIFVTFNDIMRVIK